MSATGFFIISALITALMTICATVVPSRVWLYRGIMVGLFVLLLPVGYLTYEKLPGSPKDIHWSTLQDFGEKATVVWSAQVPKEAIYLLLGVDEQEIPVYLRLEWDDRLAEQLQKAQTKADHDGTGVQMDINALLSKWHTRSWDDREPVFHPDPPAELPEKTVVKPQIQEFTPGSR